MARRKIETVELDATLPVYYTVADLVRVSGLHRTQIEKAVENGEIKPIGQTATNTLLFDSTSANVNTLRTARISKLMGQAAKLGLTEDDIRAMLEKHATAE